MKKSVLIIILFSGIVAYSQEASIDREYIKQVDKLAKNTSVKVAMQHIASETDRSRAELIMLTEIPAPPFGEDTRARKFASMLEEGGADSVWIDKEGNVLALRKGRKGNKTVALDAHLDTVFPIETDVKVKERGDTLFAPGIGDDTRGLVMVAAVLRSMEKANIETDANILFIGTTGEEGLGDLRGVKYLFGENGPSIDSWISIDGGDIGRVNTKGLGSHRYKVTFKGPGGHSWGAFGLASPAHALGSAIHYFSQEADQFTLNGPRTSYNVGRIGGGTSINSIAFESWMEIDMRSESPQNLDSMDIILSKAVQKALEYQNSLKREGPDLTVEVVQIGNRPSGEQESGIPLIQRSMAVAKYFGTTPRLSRGSTNSNIPISKGIPAVTIGRGGKGGGGHSLAEWWYDDEGYKAIQVALLTLLAESGF